jgi:hypothetical protein
MAEHKVVTTDTEIDRALKKARSLSTELLVNAVTYRPESGLDLMILHLNDGHRVFIAREDIEGLRSASPEEIARVEILGNGTGLHWPGLDFDLYVPNLLRQAYGTKRWMAQLGRLGGATRTDAKRSASQLNGKKGGRPSRAVSAV